MPMVLEGMKRIGYDRSVSFRRQLLGMVRVAAIVSTVMGARTSLADHYYVPSGSMEPTVAVGDRLLVNKLAYDLRLPFTSVRLWARADPARGDMVVFPSPESGETLVKRVIAVPGDEVTVRDGQVSLNGRQVALKAGGDTLIEQLAGHPHPLSLRAGGGPDFGPVRLPASRYLVMGDNRGNSHDGRSFGLVDRAAFRGRVEGLYLHDGHLGWYRQ